MMQTGRSDELHVEEGQSKSLFPIVGIGASAGGINALETFFENLPADLGMAFVVILHLDPTRESTVASMIQKHSRINVQDIKSGTAVSPDNVYLLPPNNNVRLERGNLILERPDVPRGLRLPIDYFFHGIAAEQAENAIAIVLSGTGSDGTLGAKHIKARGGTIMVQDPQSTEYPGMPQSLISSLNVDYIASPEQLPRLVAMQAASLVREKQIGGSYSSDKLDALLSQISDLVWEQSGQTLSVYKRSTVLRRIDRRMAINHVPTLDEYITFIKEHPTESDNLFHEILVGVTHFFRDDDSFKVLEEKVIPVMFEKRGADDSIRVWVAGCSTGEEAYSIAMLLDEFNTKNNRQVKVLIFATDIDGKAIEKARNGLFPETISASMSPEILERHFVKQDNM